MKKQFIGEDFLLGTKTARKLYHDYAAGMPIIDFHCHLSPKDIAENRKFKTITQMWLEGDHYKWRAMRACGIDERYITGNASDWEKFEQWAHVVPRTVRNPLYHWTHLELKRPFGIKGTLLNPKTAKAIYARCNAKLASKEFTTHGILKSMNVEVVCTTDDPVDSLEFHRQYARHGNGRTRMIPAFRPDKAMTIEAGERFVMYVRTLATAAGMEISSYEEYVEAIRKRHTFFHELGCRVSDHGIETAYAEDYTEKEIHAIFKRALRGKTIDRRDVLKFKSAMMIEFGKMDHSRGWVQQLHMGALRNNNTRMMRTIGPDTGYDSIGDFEIAKPLSRFLDRLDDMDRLPKTMLYNLNPRDNELLASMTGNFQDGRTPGKLQYGAAWWFLDQLDGMRKQLDALSNLGVLSQFVGMLTDSRSFLSYPRHEYFRRLLCGMLGEEMEKGLVPNDLKLVGGIVQDISYRNAKRYFNFE